MDILNKDKGAVEAAIIILDNGWQTSGLFRLDASRLFFQY